MPAGKYAGIRRTALLKPQTNPLRHLTQSRQGKMQDPGNLDGMPAIPLRPEDYIYK
jgi:hypothetical protein